MAITRRSLIASVGAIPFSLRPARHAVAQTSTPVAFGEASDRFREMMTAAPISPLEGYVNFTWVDLERHIAAFPTLDPVDVERSLPPAMIADAPYQYLRMEPVIGYAYTQIRQQVRLGAGDSLVRIARLDVDARALPETWENSGFERQDGDIGTFWNLGQNGETSGENLVEERFQGSYNAVTVLDDDLIAIASTPVLLHDVMEAYQNQTDALSEITDPLASHLYDDTTSVWHTDGSRLVLTQQFYWDVNVPDALAESDAAVGPMPVIETVTICITAGGSTEMELFQPQTREFIILKSAEPNQAEQLAKVVQWRFENLSGLYNSGPYAEGYSHLEIDILDNDLVRVTATGPVLRYFQFTHMVIVGTALLFAYGHSE